MPTTIQIDWVKIRKEVFDMLVGSPIISNADIMKWVKETNPELPDTYIKTPYTIIRMLTNGEVFTSPEVAEGKGVVMKSVKVHPKTGEKVPNIEEGWMVLDTRIQSDVATVSEGGEPDDIVKSRLQSLIPKTSEYHQRRLYGTSLTDIDVLKKAHDNTKNVLLRGPPGTGKTTACAYYAYISKIPYARVELHGGVEISDLIGQWVPSDKNKMEWIDGLLTLMVRYGGIFVADEINAMPREFSSKLHGLLDKERRLVLTEKDGEVVHAHPKFMFVACMNPNAEGTHPLSEGFKDRFDIELVYDYDKRIEKILIENGKLRDFADKVRMLKGVEIDTTVSTRMLLQYQDNMKLFGEEAAEEMLMDKFDPDERAKVKEVFDMIMRTEKKKKSEKLDDDATPGLSALFG